MDKEKIFALIVLCCIGAAIYSNTFQSAFYFDDEDSIVKNINIRNLNNLRTIWDYFPTRFITYLSLAFNYHFHKLNVFGYHLFNLAVHLGGGILVWLLTLLTLSTPEMKNKGIAAHAKPIALFSGLVFITHPIQTQAITYIIQRTASLAAFFYLGSLTLYVKARLIKEEARGHGAYGLYYFGALSFAVLAMFTKEFAITLPFALLLYEVSFLKTKNRAWGNLLPFFITLPIIPLTMAATKSVNFAEMRLLDQPAAGIAPWNYFITQFRVIITYIRLLFIPLNQNVDYDYPIARSMAEVPVLLSLILIIIILITAFRIFSKQRLISFGIFWFFLTLLPESSIIPIRDVIFEHRLYLPMFGYSIFLLSLVYNLLGRRSFKTLIMTTSVIIVCYSFLTYNRNAVWKNKFTLWDDAIRKSPNKARPYNDRGNAYNDKGEFDLAIQDFNKSIEAFPYDAKVYSNRGIAYANKGEFDRAILDYNKAIELNPKLANPYNNRGNAYSHKGDFDRAIADFNKSIEINPHQAMVYNNRGLAYGMKGILDQAIADFSKAIELNPKAFDFYNNRGIVYDMKGDLDKALSEYKKALEINPNFANTYYNLALAYFKKKDYDKTWENLHRAQNLGYKPDPQFLEGLKAASGRQD